MIYDILLDITRDLIKEKTNEKETIIIFTYNCNGLHDDTTGSNGNLCCKL